jgi:predicted lipoprotein
MRRRISTIIISSLVAATAFSCGSETGNNATDDTGPAAEQRREVLSLMGDEAVALYSEFDVEAGELDAAVTAWAADPTSENRDAARTAWREAIAAWQRAEVTQFGPAGAMSAVAGGEDLRDRIYSWPLTNACRIDQELVAEGYTTDAFADERINVKGLDALEYLLFVEGTENGCSPNSAINTDGSWAALDEAELDRRRAAYGAAITAELQVASGELVDWWVGERDFKTTLATAGTGSEVYPTSQEALNAVSDALFYLEKETKDMKVAPPAGLMSTCTETVCPELRESQWANVSVAHVRENLDGFARIHLAGFDPLLREKGATELADEMATALQAAQDAFAGLDDSLVVVLEQDPQAAVAAHDALRAFVQLFRTQFLSVLDLELPKRAEGDND